MRRSLNVKRKSLNEVNNCFHMYGKILYLKIPRQISGMYDLHLPKVIGMKCLK